MLAVISWAGEAAVGGPHLRARDPRAPRLGSAGGESWQSPAPLRGEGSSRQWTLGTTSPPEHASRRGGLMPLSQTLVLPLIPPRGAGHRGSDAGAMGIPVPHGTQHPPSSSPTKSREPKVIQRG